MVDDLSNEEMNEEDEIWDELRWEQSFQGSDKLTDKYVKLWEKYKDDPDSEKKIAKEMGWNWLMEALEEQERREPTEDDEAEDSEGESEEGEDWKKNANIKEFDFDDFHNLPVYRLAFDYALKAIKFGETLPEKSEHDQLFHKFFEGATIPAAKIAGGSAFGYDRHSIGGNIANCKRGLAAANQGIEALREMKAKDLIDPQTFKDFSTQAKEMRDALALYIVEMRKRLESGIP